MLCPELIDVSSRRDSRDSINDGALERICGIEARSTSLVPTDAHTVGNEYKRLERPAYDLMEGEC